MKIKKVLSLFLATVMATSCFSGAFAAQGSEDIPLTLEVDAPIFSVTVPTELPAHFDAAGNMVMPDNVRIENHSTLSVKVTDVKYKSKDTNGWESAPNGNNYTPGAVPAFDSQYLFFIDCACLFSKSNTDITSNIAKA